MAREFVRASSQFLENAAPAIAVPALTMACWGYVNNLTQDMTLMSLSDAGTAVAGHHLQVAGTVASDPLQVRSNNATANGNGSVPVSTWFHAGGVWVTNALRRCYLNGVAGTDNSTTVTNPPVEVTVIGRRSNTTTDYTDGRVAWAAMWNIDLTTAEMLSLAAGAYPLYIRPNNLISFWPLWGRHSPEIDLVGGFGLTVTGATAVDPPRQAYTPIRTRALRRAPIVLATKTVSDTLPVRLLTTAPTNTKPASPTINTGHALAPTVAYFSMHENTGTTTVDLVDGTTVGTFNSTPAWFAGPTGPALNFDGAADRIDVPDVNRYDTGTGPRTILVSLRTTMTATGYPVVFYNTGTPFEGYGLIIDANVPGYWCGTSPFRYGSVAINDGNWHQVAVTHTGAAGAGQVSFYLDGAFTNDPGAAVAVGGDIVRSIGNNFAGDIEWVAIWNTVLTSTQIASLAASPYQFLTGASSGSSPGELANISAVLTTTDPIATRLVELASLFSTLEVLELVPAHLTELVDRIIFGLITSIDVADALPITVADVVSAVFRAMELTDASAVRVADVLSVFSALELADTTRVTVAEATALVVLLSAADALSVRLTEATISALFLAIADAIAVRLTGLARNPLIYYGYGTATVGGSGGTPYLVTTTADSGVGSLRDALSAANRYVTFDPSLSGATITLATLIDVRANTTIAGESVAVPITIAGKALRIRTTTINAHDIIIRSLRFTGSDTTGLFIDGVDVANVVVDHCTLADAVSRNMDISTGAHDITVSWCLFYKTSGSNNQQIVGTRRVSLHHNLYRASTLNPRIQEDAAVGPATGINADVRNCVFANWDTGSGPIVFRGGWANFVKNFFTSGGIDPGDSFDVDTTTGGRAFVSGNLSEDGVTVDAESTEGSPFDTPPSVQETTPCQAVAAVMKSVGAQPLQAADQAVLNGVRNTVCAGTDPEPETVTLASLLAVADVLPAGVLDRVADLFATLNVADTTPVQVVEVSPDLFKALGLADVLAVVLDEPRPIIFIPGATEVFRDVTDVMGVRLQEAVTLFVDAFLADALPVGVTDLAAILVALAPADLARVGLLDTVDTAVTLQTADSAQVALSDALGTVQVLLDVPDTLTVAVTDIPVVLSALGLADILPVRIDELAQRVIVGGEDVTVPLGLADAISVGLTDLLDTIQVVLQASETLAVVTNDQVAALQAGLAIADVTGCGLAEALDVLAQLRAADLAGVGLQDIIPLAVAVVMTAQDSLATGLDEQRSIAVRVDTTDLARVNLAELAASLLRLDAADLLPVVLDDRTQTPAWDRVVNDVVAVTVIDSAVAVEFVMHLLGPILVATTRSLMSLYATTSLVGRYTTISRMGAYTTELV